MTKASIDLQDLRRRLYVKAKAEPTAFWGLIRPRLQDGDPARSVCDGQTKRWGPWSRRGHVRGDRGEGVEALLEQLCDELTGRTYKPLPAGSRRYRRRGQSPRLCSISAILGTEWCRVRSSSSSNLCSRRTSQWGRMDIGPKRTAHDAIKRVAEAIAQRKTWFLDFDLRAYFDNVRHDRLLEKVAQRVDDKDIMHLLKLMLKASGKKGVPQGGVISPLLSNLYPN